MNRIILIGNGFDLAHGLPTKYEHFINWYWKERICSFENQKENVSKDPLGTFVIKKSSVFITWNNFYHSKCNFPQYYGLEGWELIKEMLKDDINFKITLEPFVENICKSIETKGWVDIENEYYYLLYSPFPIPKRPSAKALNYQLDFLKLKLAQYLDIVVNECDSFIPHVLAIQNKMFEGIKEQDVAVESKNRYWDFAREYRQKGAKSEEQFVPKKTLILNFNYTPIAQQYLAGKKDCSLIHIHGDLSNVFGMIFGYGDELDENFRKIQSLNDNEYLRNMKSVHYLETDNYRKLLSFINSSLFQIYIMGHSCGSSDRTLLNTLFEHPHCVSIKPFYYYNEEKGTDDYLDIVQNISRNFTDKKKMRDRVVNKKYCKPLPQYK